MRLKTWEGEDISPHERDDAMDMGTQTAVYVGAVALYTRRELIRCSYMQLDVRCEGCGRSLDYRPIHNPGFSDGGL